MCGCLCFSSEVSVVKLVGHCCTSTVSMAVINSVDWLMGNNFGSLDYTIKKTIMALGRHVPENGDFDIIKPNTSRKNNKSNRQFQHHMFSRVPWLTASTCVAKQTIVSLACSSEDLVLFGPIRGLMT